MTRHHPLFLSSRVPLVVEFDVALCGASLSMAGGSVSIDDDGRNNASVREWTCAFSKLYCVKRNTRVLVTI